MRAIYKRELQSYFHSFLGELFIGAMLFLLGIYFSVYNLFMGYPFIGYALSSIVFVFLISIPILTMRILAEERHQRSDQLILTAPVSVSGIVIGKFLALASIFAIPVAVICLYPLVLSMFGTVSFGESYLAILGFFLYGLASIAVGVFVSSLTESQVIAAVLSFALLFLGYVMSGICNMISTTGNLLTKLLSVFDMADRFESFMNGSLQLSGVVYFLSVIVLFLVFTVQSIQKRRYQVSTRNLSMGAYSSTVIVFCTVAAVLLNVLVLEAPARYTEFDLTANKLYSLTGETEEILSSIEEDINIYVLANKGQADSTLDTTLKNYEELNSHIKVSYIDPAVNPKFFTQYTDSSVTANSVIVESAKRSKVIDYSSIYQTEMDYTDYSTTVTGYDGEGQLTSAVSYVTSDDMPKIYMLEGHGELGFETGFISAVEKENVDYETINLMDYDTVPEDAQAVVINAPTEDLSGDDVEKMLAYMEKGGDVLLVTTYTDKDLPNFNKLLDFYGVEATEGLVLEGDMDRYYQVPFYLLPEVGYDAITENVYGSGGYVFVPYAQGLTVSEKEDVEVTKLLSASGESYVRNEIETSGDYAKKEGDQEGPFEIGVKCEKTVGKESSTGEDSDAKEESNEEESGDAGKESSDGEESSVGVIYSSEYLFTQSANEIVAGTNLRLFTGTVGSLVEHTTSVSIPVKDYGESYLAMPQNTIVLLALLTVIVIPLVFLVSGFVVFIRRRRL